MAIHAAQNTARHNKTSPSHCCPRPIDCPTARTKPIPTRRNTMFDIAIQNAGFSLEYARKLVADAADDQMTAQPVVGKTLNRPAFVLGHLAWAASNGAAMLSGQPSPLPAEWKELYGQGVKPLPDRSRYA